MPTTLLLDRSPVGLRAALPAMLALTVQRVVLLGSAAAGPGDLDLVRWDGNWYRMVATVGYVHPPGIGPTGEPSALSDLAFFPLYPFLAKLVAATGCPVEVALLGIAWLATLAAGWGIFAVGRAVARARAATLLVVLWGAAPRSLVTVLPYSEPLFTAAVAWCLYFALRRRWVAAALVCAVAGLTRAAVLPLVAALVLHAVLLLAWPAGRGRGSWRGDARGLLAVATAGIAGMGAYVAWVALRTGDLDGYRNVQRTWGTTAGMPWASVRTYLTERAGGMGGFLYGDYIAIVVLVYAVLLVWMLARRDHPLLTGFAGATWLWTMAAQGFFHAKARFLLPAFPAWLPLAAWLAARPAWAQAVTVVGLSALSVVTDLAVLAGPWSP